MNDSSNIDSVEKSFDDLFANFGFTAETAGGQKLGEEIVGIVAESIAEDASQGKGAEGQDFPENSEPYRTRKGRKYGWTNPGYRTGQTMSLASLKGQPEISGDEITMVYGTGEPASRSASPTGHISEADKAATDREKAGYLTEKFGEIYAMNEARSMEVSKAVGEAFGKFAEDHFNKGG